jgi:hypothetical protein
VVALDTAAGLRRGTPRARLLCALGSFGALQIPYALWRADAPHVALAGLVVFAALPAAAVELAPRRSAGAAWVAASAVLLLFLGVHYVRGGIARNAKLALGRTHAHVVSYAGRDFRVDDAAAARSLQRAVDATARVAPRTGSFYVEHDPPASKRGSGLAGDMAHADVLLLGRRWNRETEPNGSRRLGSNAPDVVVRRRFCRRAAFGGYEVLTRCRRGHA